jgi:hypothetical protein
MNITADKAFSEEYIGLLEEHSTAFDERYIWG